MYPSMNNCATSARQKVGTPLNGFLTVGTNHEDKTRPQRSGEIARNGLTGPTASEDGCLVTGDVVEDADGSAHADCLLVSTSGLTPRGVAAGVDFSLEALLAVDFSLAACSRSISPWPRCLQVARPGRRHVDGWSPNCGFMHKASAPVWARAKKCRHVRLTGDGLLCGVRQRRRGHPSKKLATRIARALYYLHAVGRAHAADHAHARQRLAAALQQIHQNYQQTNLFILILTAPRHQLFRSAPYTPSPAHSSSF